MTKQFAEPRSHRYLEIADEVVRLIEGGTFAVGERLPSVRALSRTLRTSPATVFAAYGEIERRGLIEARPQSGFYVVRRAERQAAEPTVPSLDDAAVPVSIEELTRQLFEIPARPDSVSFDVAAPAAELLPGRAIARAFGRATRLRPSLAIAYIKPPGHLALRQAIAKRAMGSAASASVRDVIITTGATEAIHLCLRAVAKAGDIIAVESPAYYGVLQAISNLGMRALELPTSPQDGLSLPHLANALRRHPIAACFAMPNFGNPLGALMPDEKKQELVRMLTRARVPLIEDDVAGELPFEGPRPRAAKSYDERGWVLLCSSVSKVLSAGARIGWVISERFRDHIVTDQWSATGAPSTPSQLAMADLLGGRAYDRHLGVLRATVRRTMLAMSRTIEDRFGEGVMLSRPRGGLVLWVGLPVGVDSAELGRRALREGIAVTPGLLFSPRPIYREFIRLNCALVFTERVERALVRLGAIVAQLRDKVCR